MDIMTEFDMMNVGDIFKEKGEADENLMFFTITKKTTRRVYFRTDFAGGFESFFTKQQFNDNVDDGLITF